MKQKNSGNKHLHNLMFLFPSVEEFEVYAEITAQGAIAILGTGVQVGAAEGLRFLFRRCLVSSDGK